MTYNSLQFPIPVKSGRVAGVLEIGSIYGGGSPTRGSDCSGCVWWSIEQFTSQRTKRYHCGSSPSFLFVCCNLCFICCHNGQTQEDGQLLYPDVNIGLRPGVG